jgi:hypothetical protein
MEQVEGWEPLTENLLKQRSISAMRESLGEYSRFIRAKDFFLMSAPPETSFYLGDDPVILANERDFGPYGNLGLAVPGIQISMPIASDLQLCCWCPTIMKQMNIEVEQRFGAIRDQLLAQVMRGVMRPNEMKTVLDDAVKPKNAIEAAIRCGKPLAINNDNVIWHNAKQMAHAFRHVICARGDFQLASDFNKKHPGTRRAFKFE